MAWIAEKVALVTGGANLCIFESLGAIRTFYSLASCPTTPPTAAPPTVPIVLPPVRTAPPTAPTPAPIAVFLPCSDMPEHPPAKNATPINNAHNLLLNIISPLQEAQNRAGESTVLGIQLTVCVPAHRSANLSQPVHAPNPYAWLLGP